MVGAHLMVTSESAEVITALTANFSYSDSLITKCVRSFVPDPRIPFVI